MKNNFTPFLKTCLAALFMLLTLFVNAQSAQLKIKDFAIWGGSGNAEAFQAGQGVFLKGKVTVTGNIGSNHLVDLMDSWKITGFIFSGNRVDLKGKGQLTGNLFAMNADPNSNPIALQGREGTKFTGNLTANGKVDVKTGPGANKSTIVGKVSVPSPSASNYTGPAPSGGINNLVVFPTTPVMPAITNFDNLVGSYNVNYSRVLFPGVFKKMELKGGQTITLRGPGNYVFDEIKVSGNNNSFVFDLNNTTEGTINIYVKKNAQFGKIMVKAVKGDLKTRVYTEVHGNGAENEGYAFQVEARGAIPEGSYIWLGNVWAPNGGISIKGARKQLRPHIMGALWSTKKVDITENTILTYDAPLVSTDSYIDPYYAPPTDGKVDSTSNIIGAELTSLAQNPGPITSLPQNEIFRFDGEGRVMIEVISKAPNDNTLKQELADLGMTDTVDNGPHSFVITGYFPINLLFVLNSNPLIEYVRPLYPPVLSRGQVTTQGDKTMRSDIVRERFGLDGSGVKIGVLSDSYNAQGAAQDDIDQGDLPGVKSSGEANDNEFPVQVLQELRQGGHDEGRAMLQIVHDVAPKAKLAFRTGFLTAGDFAKGILELADPALEGGKCDIIVDDLSYITEPFFRDGVVARVVDQVVGQGVTYFTSAGNFGKRSYEATFRGVDNPAVVPAPAQLHQFGTNASDIYQSILLKPGNYTIVLQWDDEFHSLGEGGVQTDLDLYLVGPTGLTLFGFNRSNLFKDPFEVCPFTVREETTAKLMVVRASGNNNVRFKYIIFRGDATILDYEEGNSTIVGHANAKGAISVGAMFYENKPGVTTNWPGVASFSSRGGTFTLENNAFTTRNKPDIIAPNGVNTTVFMGGEPFNDGDSYPNFFGTSAAAPHAAGVGALLIQARKKFNQQTVVTPEEIRQQLISRAGKFSYLSGNFNFEGGFGYLQADSSLTQIANAIPIVDTMMAVIPGSQTGVDSFQVKIVGRYLTPSTRIYKNGVALPKIIANNPNEAIALAPPIAPGEDPAFQLFNGAISPSGEDGGLSEPYYFFSERKTVTIKAENKSRKYLQDNPQLTADIRINNVPIEETGISRFDINLGPDNLVLNTIATPRSRAGQYGIFPDFSTPLAPDDPLLTQYRFIFTSGTLNVGKLPLKIRPQYKKVKYGEFPENITYDYEFDMEPYSGSGDPGLHITQQERVEEIKRIHKEHMAENALIAVKGFYDDRNTLTEEDLANISTLASFQAVMNAKKYLVQDGKMVPLPASIDKDDIGNQRFIVEVPLNAMLNYHLDPAYSPLTNVDESDLRKKGLLNLKSLAKGEASGSIINGQLKAMVNGQLMGMVNGEFEAPLNINYLIAIVDGYWQFVNDIIYLNGQLRALVNGQWKPASNGQFGTYINGSYAYFDLSVQNGQLRALVNGSQEMTVLGNGQLKALVNGQDVTILNGQLRALVNGQLVPIVNNELMGVSNGQLRAMVNGEVVASVNGQLLALINGELEEATEVTLINGQLRALVNGQLRALVNGQLKALVNGDLTDIDNNSLVMENGQLRALVNGQLRALVNGQLKALVNGQLRALVNAEEITIEKVIQLANGQLKALVNGNYIPVRNGQLKALVNGQLRAMVNGELMAEVNGEITFTIFENGQLKALVNGVFEPLVNGQLKAMVNGQLSPVDSYSIVNGQLKALVNGEEWIYPNGQLKALVNGQLKALVNNFDVSGANNNAKTMVLVDQDDIEKQEGDLGGMFAMPMVTSLDAGNYNRIFPAAFINENYEVTYESGVLEIAQAPVFVKTGDTSKSYGSDNPLFTDWSVSGLAYGDSVNLYGDDGPYCPATALSPVGLYPISINLSLSDNYTRINEYGNLRVLPKLLTVTADNIKAFKTTGAKMPDLTITYDGLVGDDTEDSVCVTYIRPSSPKVINDLDRTITYSNVSINGAGNVFFATPGQSLNLSGSFVSYNNPSMYCPGCITQFHIGMGDGVGNFFTTCYESTYSGSTWDLSKSFNAPSTPGVYYITALGSWWYFCNQFPDANHKVADNDRYAIAVVVVNATGTEPEDKITASVAPGIDLTSANGDYPITLAACAGTNPNYNVVLVNGTLSILPDPGITDLNCLTESHLWRADGNFADVNTTGNGTPHGGVTATGEGRVGLNSFSFDGSTGYISSTDTLGASVWGQGNFAVSAWVKTTSANPMVIINQRDEGIWGEYMFKIGGGHDAQSFDPEHYGQVYLMMYEPINNPTAIGVFSNTRVNDGKWHHVKGVRVDNTMSIYIDGVLESTILTPGTVDLNGNLKTFIGADIRDNGSYFDGLLDNVKVEICGIGVGGVVDHAEGLHIMAQEEKVKITTDKLYPNPATNSVRIELTEDVVNINEILVLDGVGKANRVITSKIDDGVYQLNVSGLPRGIYFVKARTASGLRTFKFVKM